MATDELRSPLLPPRRPRRVSSAAATLALLLVAGLGPLPSACCGTSRSRHRPRSSPPDPVELTLLAAANDKGAGMSYAAPSRILFSSDHSSTVAC